MTRSIYLLGGPGSGKSTLMARLLQGWALGAYERLTARELFGHRLVGPELELGVYLGKMRPEYPGTDALSLSVAPQALIWLESLDPHLDWVFGEGARLAHSSFLQALHARTDLLLCYLEVEPGIAFLRREERPGKKLTEKFAQAVTTKAKNTFLACQEAGMRTVYLDGSMELDRLAELVLSPTSGIGGSGVR